MLVLVECLLRYLYVVVKAEAAKSTIRKAEIDRRLSEISGKFEQSNLQEGEKAKSVSDASTALEEMSREVLTLYKHMEGKPAPPPVVLPVLPPAPQPLPKLTPGPAF